MKYALSITGVVAAIAMACPMLVVIGYFFLIIPGIILTLAPTAFVYLAATAIIRRMLPIASPIAATTAGFGIALLLGWLVMQPSRLKAITAYQTELSDDVVPQQAFELDGHVRLETPNRRSDPECDYLCLAMLDLPRVQGVTVLTAGRGKEPHREQTAAYTLQSAEADRSIGLYPTMPGQIVHEHPAIVSMLRGTQVITASKAAEADWAVRLAGPERLRLAEPVAADRADWIIHFDRRVDGRKSQVRRITVSDATGKVRFRKSYIKHAVPAPMFCFGFKVQSGMGTIAGASFHVGQQTLESGERSLKLEPTLLTAINAPVPRCDEGAIQLLRQQAQQALDDPKAKAVRLDLARRYLGLFFFDTTQQDHSLIARIVADDRVREIDEQLKNVFSKQKTPLAMRVPYAERIVMDHTSARLRHWLAERLAGLPLDAFTDPTTAHLKIWNTPELRNDAAPFIARLADLGPVRAMPTLGLALDEAIEVPHWSERRQLIDGIREAFIRLGPAASAAAPRLRKLFLRRPSPIMNNSRGAEEWRFALARMGVAIEDLPFFPNQSAASIERMSNQIANKLHRYEQEHLPDDET